jgi:hypothetical protein
MTNGALTVDQLKAKAMPQRTQQEREARKAAMIVAAMRKLRERKKEGKVARVINPDTYYARNKQMILEKIRNKKDENDLCIVVQTGNFIIDWN